MKKKKIHPWLVLSTIALLVVFFIVMVVFDPLYQKLTSHYFDFLERIGYYKHVYSDSCTRRCLQNIPHDLPYVLFVFMPVITIFGYIFYSLSNDKEYLRKLFTNKIAEKDLKTPDLTNDKQTSIFYGIVAVYFFIIIVFFVLPLALFLFD